MSVVLKRILGILLSVLCIVTGTSICCMICNHPSDGVENTVASFYREPKGSLDVVAFGASAVGAAFYPAVVWQETGITSYALHVVATGANVNVSMMREILSSQPNAVLLLDADGFTIHNHILEQQDPIRLWVDSMPWNSRKIQTIRELCPDDTAERLFPFMRYHRNMTSLYAYLPIAADLLKKQINHSRDPMRGAFYENGQCRKALSFLNTADISPQPLDTLPDKALQDVLSFCQANDLHNIVFVDYPKAYDSEENRERNALYGARVHFLRQAVEPYGYSVFSYNEYDNPAGLDLQTDFLDTLHLNQNGAMKFSAFFAHWLEQNFTFPEKDAQTSAIWDADSQAALKPIRKEG